MKGSDDEMIVTNITIDTQNMDEDVKMRHRHFMVGMAAILN